MTSSNRNRKDDNEWIKFLETGRGGQRAVKTRPVPKVRKVSNRQRMALRRVANGRNKYFS